MLLYTYINYLFKNIDKKRKRKGVCDFPFRFLLKDQVCTIAVVVYSRTNGIILIAIRKATADIMSENPSTIFRCIANQAATPVRLSR